MDPLTALATLGPLAVDAGKALIQRFIAPDSFKPTNVADWLQMRKADSDMFVAMQDKGGGSGPAWVDAVIRLQRPAVAALALGTWAFQELTTPGGATPACANFAAVIGFYLFGDRTLFYARKAGGK